LRFSDRWLNDIFQQLRRRGNSLSEWMPSAEVGLALLEADVNYVYQRFLNGAGRAVGAEVSKALNPAQQ
jgi:signal recognition particle GTPase